jgi:hypothetical protein
MSLGNKSIIALPCSEEQFLHSAFRVGHSALMRHRGFIHGLSLTRFRYAPYRIAQQIAAMQYGVVMRTLRSSLNPLQALRRKFEALLEAAREKATRFGQPPAHPKTRLREVTAFGRNPGNLRMLMHVPEQLPAMAPLVVALHGCNQTADEYDYGTGWSSLADRLGFAVVYPEQQPANNPKNCFSWFVPGDISRGHGEALSHPANGRARYSDVRR